MPTSIPEQRASYPIEEACALLGGLSRQTIYDLINAGTLRSFKIGRRRLVSADAIQECIRALEGRQSAAQ